MASDDFGIQAVQHIIEVEISILFADGAVEGDLQENIPKLFNDPLIILPFDRLYHFICLFYQMRQRRLLCISKWSISSLLHAATMQLTWNPSFTG